MRNLNRGGLSLGGFLGGTRKQIGIVLLNEEDEFGSRLFARLPASLPRSELQECILDLPGTGISDVIKGEGSIWIDFTFHEYRFVINSHEGGYLISADEKNCPEYILRKIALHVSAAQRRTKLIRPSIGRGERG